MSRGMVIGMRDISLVLDVAGVEELPHGNLVERRLDKELALLLALVEAANAVWVSG